MIMFFRLATVVKSAKEQTGDDMEIIASRCNTHNHNHNLCFKVQEKIRKKKEARQADKGKG